MPIFVEHVWICIDDLSEYWVRLDVVQRKQHSLRNEQKRLSVLNVRVDSRTKQSAFEEGRIVQLRALDTVF